MILKTHPNGINIPDGEENNILLRLINKFPNKDWSYNLLSLNPNITWGIVQSNPDKNGFIIIYHQIQV